MKNFWVTGKTIFIALIILVALFATYKVFSKQEPVQQDEKKLYIEKYQLIGSLKYDELEYSRKAQEAKEAKDKILESLNGTGASLGKIQ